MKVKTSELTPQQLNAVVSNIEGHEANYATDWAQSGPIIEMEWLQLTPWPNESDEDMRWHCLQHDARVQCHAFGPTPLIAAMRCYVASKLGDEVDVSDQLTETV